MFGELESCIIPCAGKGKPPQDHQPLFMINARSSNFQNDFTDMLAGFHMRMGLMGLSQRKCAVEDRGNAPSRQMRPDLIMQGLAQF